MKLLFLHLMVLLTTTGCMIANTHTKIQWKIAAKLPLAEGNISQLGLAGVLAGVSNNVLLVGGGANFPDSMPWVGGKKKYYNDLYVFKKDEQGQLKPLQGTLKLPIDMAYVASCTTPLGVVVVGGENANGLSDKAYLLQWDDGKDTIVVKTLPSLPEAITNAAITADGNTVFVAGGEMFNGVSDKLYTLDVSEANTGWKVLADLPKPVSHAVLVMLSSSKGKELYLLGGRCKTLAGVSDLFSTVFALNLETKSWSQKASLLTTLSAGTGVAFGPNEIIMIGGDKGAAFHKTEELIASINAEKDPLKKDQLNKEKMQLQTNHPGFSNEVLVYNAAKDEWKKMASVPFKVPVTTTAVLWHSEILIPSGEIKAGVRTPQILAGKLHINSKQ